ncbi:MAG TPA: pyridoxamine 5'-phosphate oxidase family protein, partial [Acidimicrobiia bacterium]|nr:pyridoxamine 5'-phosphate oxidase family protein [Acidimicrobiia bacterium]
MVGVDDSRAWELISGAQVAVLGTQNPDGTAHLVPFTFVAVSESRALWSAVDEKPKQSRHLQRLSNIRRDPRVTVLAQHYEPDWSHLWWVRGEGQAALHDQPPVGLEQSLIERYPSYQNQRLEPWVA